MTDSYTSSLPRVRQPTRVLHESDRFAFSSNEDENHTPLRRNGHSSYSYIPTKRFEVREEENNSSRRRSKKWETDDESLKPSHRHSVSSLSQISNTMEENTTKSLLYLLNKEREKRCTLQKAYEQTTQAFRELQKTHKEDISALESDIQTLQTALRKEAKVSSQLSQVLRESHAKFAEEMRTWAGKVMEMELQGKELQKTLEKLEKEEDETVRLRQENQALREQLKAAGCATIIETTAPLSRRNLEDVRKVGSMEDRDDVSVSAESTKPSTEANEHSDAESIINYSKISELNERITELEQELASVKEQNERYKVTVQELETEKQNVKQIEDKHEKQVALLKATIAQSKKQTEGLTQELRKVKFTENQKRAREEKLQKEKEKELQLQKEKQLQLLQLQQKQKQQQLPPRSPSPPSPPLPQQQTPKQQQQGKEAPEPNNVDRRQQLSLLNKRNNKVSVSETFPAHERQNSLTSTNSGSLEDRSGSTEGGGSTEDKSTYIEGDQSEAFSEEEEEEERDDQSSSFCTGSENWVQSHTSEETVDQPTENFVRVQSGSGDEEQNPPEENDDVILDAILSDREDRALPLIGHYSAAEFTEDEDSVTSPFEKMFERGRANSRRHNLVGGRFGSKLTPGNSLTRTLNLLNREIM